MAKKAKTRKRTLTRDACSLMNSTTHAGNSKIRQIPRKMHTAMKMEAKMERKMRINASIRADTLPTAALFFMAHLPEKSDLTHRQPLMGEQNRPEKQFKATCVANARMFFALNYIVQHG